MVATVDKVYRPHGNIRRLFMWLDGVEPPPMEVLVEGPAGTGKTRGIGEFHYEWCDRFPKTRGLVVRKFRQDLRQGWQKTWEERVLWPGHYLLEQEGFGKGDNRSEYRFDNGSQIVIGHMENPERWYSTEWDWVYWNEATESRADQWIKLGRSLRVGDRETAAPFRLLMGDTNPHLPRNHLNLRCNEGRCLRLKTTHADNPSIEPEYLDRLRNMTGVDYRRLYLGEWCSAEGMIIDCWDEERHVVSDLPKMQFYVAGLDFGYGSEEAGAGACVVLGYDEDGVAYVVHEVYRRKKDLDWWVDKLLAITERYKPAAIIADSAEPRSIQFMRTRGLDRIHPVAKVKRGGKTWGRATRDHLRTLFAQGRLYVLEDTARLDEGPDPKIAVGARCLTDEIGEWVYRTARTGFDVPLDMVEEPDPRCADHAIDALIYALTWSWQKDFTPKPEDRGIPDYSMGSILGHAKVLKRAAGRFGATPDELEEMARRPGGTTFDYTPDRARRRR